MNIDKNYRSMSMREMRDYIYELHEEVYKLRHKNKRIKESLLGAQRICENQHYRNMVMNEWKRYKALQNMTEGVVDAIPPLVSADNKSPLCPECGGLNRHLSTCKSQGG